MYAKSVNKSRKSEVQTYSLGGQTAVTD